MLKNVIISVLAAALIADKLSMVIMLAPLKQVGLWIGITAILIIFCFFMEMQAEKWKKRRARVQYLQQILGRLAGKETGDGQKRSGRIRSTFGNHA